VKKGRTPLEEEESQGQLSIVVEREARRRGLTVAKEGRVVERVWWKGFD